MKSDKHYLQIKINTERIFESQELEDLALKTKKAKIAEFTGFLAPFDPQHILTQWRELVHQVDDLLNFRYGLSATAWEQLLDLSLEPAGVANPGLAAVLINLGKAFGQATMTRFNTFHEQLHHYQQRRTMDNLNGDGYPLDHDLLTISDVLNYFSSVRIYLMVIDPLVTIHARGKRLVDAQKMLYEFLPRIDHVLNIVTQTYFKLLSNRCY
jgi:hypothetical protein